MLVAIINENNQVLLLKQNYISTKNYTLCSGYLKKGDTLEETVAREVLEETEQRVLSCEYVQSYYFAPKNLIMTGFIAYVKASEFGSSNEFDGLVWVDLDKAVTMVEREKNYSGVHLDKCIQRLRCSTAMTPTAASCLPARPKTLSACAKRYFPSRPATITPQVSLSVTPI